MIAPGHDRTAYRLAVGIAPQILMQLAPLPGLVVVAHQAVTGADGARQTPGQNGWFVFFLRGTNIVPEGAVLTAQQVVCHRRVRQVAVTNKCLPASTALRAQLIKEELSGAFLQKQLIQRRIGRGRAEFCVKSHQSGEGFTGLGLIRHGQPCDRLLEWLRHAGGDQHGFQFGREQRGLVVLHRDHTASILLAAACQLRKALTALR